MILAYFLVVNLLPVIAQLDAAAMTVIISSVVAGVGFPSTVVALFAQNKRVERFHRENLKAAALREDAAAEHYAALMKKHDELMARMFPVVQNYGLLVGTNVSAMKHNTVQLRVLTETIENVPGAQKLDPDRIRKINNEVAKQYEKNYPEI